MRGTLKLESKRELVVSSGSFFSGHAVVKTEIFLVNEFSRPISLSNFYVDDANFRVVNVAEVTAMNASPGERLGPILVERKAVTSPLSSAYDTPLHVVTNISTYHTFALQVSGKKGKLDVERAVPTGIEKSEALAPPDCIELITSSKKGKKKEQSKTSTSGPKKKKRKKKKKKRKKNVGQRFQIPSQSRVKVAIGSRDYRTLSHQELARRISQVCHSVKCPGALFPIVIVSTSSSLTLSPSLLVLFFLYLTSFMSIGLFQPCEQL